MSNIFAILSWLFCVFVSFMLNKFISSNVDIFQFANTLGVVAALTMIFDLKRNKDEV